MQVGQLAAVQRTGWSQPPVSLYLTDDPEDEQCTVLDDDTCVLLLERCVRASDDGDDVVEYRVLVGDSTGWISAWNLREL